MSERAESRWLAALAMLLIAAPLLLYAHQAATRSVGWDALALRAAVQTLHEGDDPYRLEDLRRRQAAFLSSTFQPLVLRLALPLLFVPAESVAWLVLGLGAAALLAVVRLVEARDRLFALALLCSGFAGWSSYLVTGNLVTLAELLAVFVLLSAAGRGSLVVPWLALAVLAFLKLTPGFFALPLAWWSWQSDERRRLPRALGWSAALFLGLNLLSAVSSGGYYLDFFRSLLGLIPGQPSPIRETRSGSANPTPLLLAADCFRLGGPAVGLAFVVGLGGLAWWVRGALRRPFLAAPEGLPFLLLLGTLLMRVKPYFLLPIACLLYFCVKRLDSRGRILVVLLFGALPLALFAAVGVGPPADRFGEMAAQNHQTLLLLLAVAVLYPLLRHRLGGG